MKFFREGLFLTGHTALLYESKKNFLTQNLCKNEIFQRRSVAARSVSLYESKKTFLHKKSVQK